MKLSKSISNIGIYALMLVISFTLGVSACTQKQDTSEKNDTDAMVERASHEFAAPIEEAHNMSTWKQKGALKTDVLLSFGGQTALDATMFIETSGPGIRLEIGDDTVAVFDGQQAWASPSDSAVTPFNLKTAPYFLKAPYKLNDPGTKMNQQAMKQMNGNDYETAKMTFESGTGDTPDDWYMLYRNQENNQLHAMAYIVTAGKTVKEANQNPHAITYENIQMIDGVPVSTKWNFWVWDEENGITGDPIGQATLSNTQFVEKKQLFTKPQGALKMKQ